MTAPNPALTKCANPHCRHERAVHSPTGTDCTRCRCSRFRQPPKHPRKRKAVSP